MTSQTKKWIPFSVAAGLLVVLSITWPLMAKWLGIALQKEPVPWPDGVRVDSNFRNLTLPDQFGPMVKASDGRITARFTQVTADGELDKTVVETPNGPVVKPIFDGQADGEKIHRKDMLESLDIGSSLDELRLGDRRSNWYVQRVYRDHTEDPTLSPYCYWTLDVVYYTGGAVTVPHVADVCLLAAGATQGERLVLPVYPADRSGEWDALVRTGQLQPVPDVWRSEGQVVSLPYTPQSSQGLQYVQYYVFSFNGQPKTDRKQVRLSMIDPFQKYVYYAKVQVIPMGRILDRSEADERAAEFFRYALPAVLTQLPSSETVEALESQADSGR